MNLIDHNLGKVLIVVDFLEGAEELRRFTNFFRSAK